MYTDKAEPEPESYIIQQRKITLSSSGRLRYSDTPVSSQINTNRRSILISPKLREQLPEFTMEHVGEMDRGAVERRVNYAIKQCLQDIARFPFRDGGKVEPRKVVLELVLTPEVKAVKVGVEVAGRQQEVDSYELHGISVRAKVKSAVPDAETADVRMVCDIQNNQILDVRFNPDNNDRPDQLELDLE